MFKVKNKTETITDILGLQAILKMCCDEVKRTFNTCDEIENRLFIDDSKNDEYKKMHIIDFNNLKMACLYIHMDIQNINKRLEELKKKEFQWARDNNDLSILDLEIKQISIRCNKLERVVSDSILRL